ncbi:DUF6844 domain-containing protein [Roseococcus microcysteis]|uniref:DUF6844 domain-containing protein n=1 Tax=Roseococcus microcysteis TaxID=2771361 RepID=UPI00168BC375|nr:hypothetical protein [Roseococcus microcysteis]
MRRRNFALGTSGLLLAGGATAQGVGQTETDFVQLSYASRQRLEDAIDKYITDSGFAGRADVLLEFGAADVNVRGDHPDWARHRTLAFDSALLEAQSKLVSRLNTRIVAESIERLFRAGNSEPPPFQAEGLNRPGQMNDLLRRLLAVARGRLDNELRELGIEPETLNQAPEPQRHVMLARSLRQTSVRRSVGELVGFEPVQTFEVHDGRGNFRIGVVMVGSERSKAIARDILQRRGQFTPEPARAMDLRQVVADRSRLLDDFGVRRVTDEAGMPALLSFAQWGIGYRGNDRVRLGMELDIAGRQVREMADRQIAEYLAGSGQFDSNSEIGMEIEQAVQRHADGYVETSPSTTALVDGLRQVMRRRANLQGITGLSTLLAWSQTHPVTNQPIIGAVRVWSASADQATRAFRDGRTPQGTAVEPNNSAGQPGMRQGRPLTTSRDF